VLAAEVRIFDGFLKRVESKITYSATRSVRGGGSVVSTLASTSLDEVASSGRRRTGTKSPSHQQGAGGGGSSGGGGAGSQTALALTAEQKCEVAQTEVERYAEETRAAGDAREKLLDELKVGRW